MVKACIFYATGRMNLRQNDIVSSGINFYYSVFHNCVSVVSLGPYGGFLNKGIIKWKDRLSAPKKYIPCTHQELISKIEKIDQELAKILTELQEIREYLNYGPYVCSDYKPDWQPILFTCEIDDPKKKLETYDAQIFNAFLKSSEIVNDYLNDTIQKFVFCLWGDQILKLFKGKLIFSDSLYNDSQKIWLQIREKISPRKTSKKINKNPS